jgi:hypothetical protein
LPGIPKWTLSQKYIQGFVYVVNWVNIDPLRRVLLFPL